MKVLIPNKKLKQSVEDEKGRRKQYGVEMAKKIHLRLEALASAEKLSDFWPPYSPPERLHELKGDLAGIFSMDLKHPYRLLFRPVHALADNPATGNLPEIEKWRTIDTVEVIAIEDTHG
jgi:proteic killer suppression protein